MIEGKYLYFTDDLTDLLDIRRKVFHRDVNTEDSLAEKTDQESIHAVAYSNSIPVATARLHTDKHLYYLDEIAVLEEEQGKGYGDFVTRMLVDKAFILGGDEVFVYSPVNMKEFFEKIGFKSWENKCEKDRLVLVNMKICQNDLLKKCQNKGNKKYY